MPPGMMPSIAAGIPPGATLTIPGGYLGEGTERGRFVTSELAADGANRPTTTAEAMEKTSSKEIPPLGFSFKLQGVAQC